MSSVILNGDTSGAITLAAPTVAGTNTITLPANTGTMVTTASSAVVTPAMLTQPLTSGTAQASTSVTSLDFTGIPSWAKRVTLMFNDVSTNGTANIVVQLGAGSVDSSASYKTGISYGLSTAAPNISGTAVGTSFAVSVVWSASQNVQGVVVFNNLGSSNTWVMSGMMTTSSAVNGAVYTTGSKALSGTLDRLRITSSNGTDAFDAGTINILYE